MSIMRWLTHDDLLRLPSGATRTKHNSRVKSLFYRVHGDSMHKTILLGSRDRNLQATRASVFERAGYRTMRTASLTSAVQLSAHCQMSIIGHTFRPAEQDDFINLVPEANPSVFVLCLRYGLAQRSTLLMHVAQCCAAQPGDSRICVIEESNGSRGRRRFLRA
jgi:hypothetical protein